MITGTWQYKGGSGTVTVQVPAGAQIMQIVARSAAGGSVQIFGGDVIPIVAGASQLVLIMEQRGVIAVGAGAAGAIIFTSTDAFYVDWVKAGAT